MGSRSPDAVRLSGWTEGALRRVRHPSLVAAAALGSLLAFIAIGRLGRGVAWVIQPGEVTFGEAILYDHAARIVRGEPLYQPLDRPPYTIAAYTPVYYGLAAALQAIVGPGFPPGRMLSLTAGIAAAALVGYLASRRARSRWAGAFAALLFLVLGFAGGKPWFSLYKEDMLGVALALGAIATLSGGRSTRRLVIAGVLAGLAILTKQTFVAAAVAGTVWLLRDDRKHAAVFAGACLTIVLMTGVALEVATGEFLANAFFAIAVPFRWETLRSNLRSLAHFQAVPLALAALYLLDRARRGRREEADLLVLFWAASFLPLVGLAKAGSSHNYWIELAAATAILATLAIWVRLSRQGTYADQWRGVLPVLLLGANVAVVMSGFGSSAVPVLSVRQAGPSQGPDFGKLVERVRSEPREVLADPPDVVVLAGRRNVLELYFSTIRYSQGQWDLTPLVRQSCRGEVSLLVLRYKLESEGRGTYDGYAYWPPPILAALRESMVLQTKQAGRFLYVPLESAAGASAVAIRSGICRDAAASQ